MSGAAQKSSTLTPRDVAILTMTAYYDGLTVQQIRRRFWPNFGSRSPCYRRIAYLIEAGYLRAVRLPSASSLGSGPSWLTVGPAAYPILTEYLGLTPAELKRLRRSFVPMFWAHEVGLRDFRLTVELGCAALNGVALKEWTTEAELKKHPIKVRPDGEGRPGLELVPDGRFELSLGRRTQRFYVEYDRGTIMAPRRFKAKLRAYFLHLRVSPAPVLFLVPDAARLRAIERWAREEAAELGTDPTIIWIAQSEQLTRESVLTSPVWQIVGGPSPAALVPPQWETPVAAANLAVAEAGP
jgi:hypothetical protein